MISSYVFWIVIVIVILIVMVFTANFTLTRKPTVEQVKDEDTKYVTPVISSLSSEASAETLVGSDSKSRAEESPSSSASSRMSARLEYNLSREEPYLPFVVSHPDYRPPTVREWNKEPSKLEAATKIVAEEMFAVKFHTVFHDKIRNPETGQALQLDLYNEELNLAFECNGEQHYHYVPWFHKRGIQDYHSQIRRDRYKVEACDRLGIYLITIPYNCPLNRIKEFIRYYLPEQVSMRRALQT